MQQVEDSVMKVPVYDKAGELLEEMAVDEACFGGAVRKDLLRQAILAYEANQRAGTASTRTTGQGSHSGAKPWSQKHTGRARAGSRNSAIWVGGGVTHGPKPRDFSQKLNKKMRTRAVASAVLAKLRAGQVKIVDGIELAEPKTREMVRILKALGVQRSFLLVLPRHDATLWRCTRNIPGAWMMTVGEINAYQLVRARDVIFTRQAFQQVMERSSRSAGTPEALEAPAAEGH